METSPSTVMRATTPQDTEHNTIDSKNSSKNSTESPISADHVGR